MKVGEYDVPEGLLYTKEHEWLKMLDPQRALVGVTDYAAKLLQDVVYVSLPKAGAEVKQMEAIGSVESIKAVADIYSPVSGRVTAVNQELETKPELVSQTPYQDGWMVEIAPSNLEADRKNLLDAEGYASHIRELASKETE